MIVKMELYRMVKSEKIKFKPTIKKEIDGALKVISHILVEIIEYSPNSVIIKTIIKKSTGKISVMSFDSSEEFTEKISPFTSYAQIIEGRAEMVIDNIPKFLELGQCIIIPAHSPNRINPNGPFKMILTIIKSEPA